MGMKIEYRFEKHDGEYIISAFCADGYEEVKFPDIDEEAEAMFGFVVSGKALPGTVKYVLEDYALQNHF